jgi:hypothetical protein
MRIDHLRNANILASQIESIWHSDCHSQEEIAQKQYTIKRLLDLMYLHRTAELVRFFQESTDPTSPEFMDQFARKIWEVMPELPSWPREMRLAKIKEIVTWPVKVD